jgi:hypothetical protein
VSADFKAGNLFTPQSTNRYTYSVNDPINLADPFGLEPLNCPPGYTRIYNGHGPGYCAPDPELYVPPPDGPPQRTGGGPDFLHQVIAVLTKCILDQFGVLTTNFEPSAVSSSEDPDKNTNGQFTGIGQDQFGDSPRVPDAPEYAIITVTNDVKTKDYDAIITEINKSKRYEEDVPRERGGANGYTDPTHPHVNYSENDTKAALALQIFELGNSLEVITKGSMPGKLHDPTQDPGAKLSECVRSGLAGQN